MTSRDNDVYPQKWIHVVGAQDRDEFWWICDECFDESEHQSEVTAAYGLARGHAAWHRWSLDDIGWGWPDAQSR